jgi:hypothetical protein
MVESNKPGAKKAW